MAKPTVAAQLLLLALAALLVANVGLAESSTIIISDGQAVVSALRNLTNGVDYSLLLQTERGVPVINTSSPLAAVLPANPPVPFRNGAVTISGPLEGIVGDGACGLSRHLSLLITNGVGMCRCWTTVDEHLFR
jgi:hypothetical protein